MKDNNEHGSDNLTLTVHAPNNSSHQFTVRAHDRVDKLARAAVEHFVGEGLMQSADCGLVLVDAGAAVPLDDTSRLDEHGLQDGALLKLVVKEPKTDGMGR